MWGIGHFLVMPLKHFFKCGDLQKYCYRNFLVSGVFDACFMWEQIVAIYWWLNTLRLWRNWGHFPDDIFICIFLNENVWILLKISLNFVPHVRINNTPAFVQIMAWHQPGDKPLSGPMMVYLTDAYMRHSASMSKYKWDVTPLLMHWGYVSFASSHQCGGRFYWCWKCMVEMFFYVLRTDVNLSVLYRAVPGDPQCAVCSPSLSPPLCLMLKTTTRWFFVWPLPGPCSALFQYIDDSSGMTF